VMSNASCGNDSVLIGTQDPGSSGGVRTILTEMIGWVRRQKCLEPRLAYSPSHRNDPVNVRPWNLQHVFRGPTVRLETFNEIPAFRIGRRFPDWESLHAVGNRHLWRSVLDRYRFHQVVCGYALTALPQALAGKRFILWVASSMSGDKRTRVRTDPLRRLLHGLQSRELERLEKFVLRRASWIFALSRHTHRELTELGADPARMSLLPCPLNISRFIGDSVRCEAPTIVCTGRHTDPRKNTRLLIRAFAKVLREMPAARLVLVGESNEALHRFSIEAGIGDRVRFTGVIAESEMIALLRGASVFAMPSDQEGLGIAALEAMACGLPVVSSRCGGPEEFVRQGETGSTVDVGDARGMADALIAILRDDVARRTMGAAARRLVETEYSHRRFDATVLSAYSRVWPDRFKVGAAGPAEN